MSLVINTNVASLNAQRSLQSASELNKTAMERLSSGKKVNSASDDAAGGGFKEPEPIKACCHAFRDQHRAIHT